MSAVSHKKTNVTYFTHEYNVKIMFSQWDKVEYYGIPWLDRLVNLVRVIEEIFWEGDM